MPKKQCADEGTSRRFEQSRLPTELQPVYFCTGRGFGGVMLTIGWRDVEFGEAPGLVRFRDLMVTLKAEHIARWKDDPDGRFQLRLNAQGTETAELEKFYPSL